MHDHRPDTHPFVIDVRELGRRAGAMSRVERTVPAPADLTSMGATVPAGSDLELDLRLESVIEGVLVSGTATAQVRAECSRCLDPVHDEITVELTELYAYPETDARGRLRAAPDDGQAAADLDERPLDGDRLDLEPALRDALVVALPLAPVCRDDCPGLCPQCGARLADDPDHRHEQYDPRWAALGALSESLTEPTRPTGSGRPSETINGSHEKEEG